jgi:hypothetical protein
VVLKNYLLNNRACIIPLPGGVRGGLNLIKFTLEIIIITNPPPAPPRRGVEDCNIK